MGETDKFIEEMTKVRPEVLTPEAKKLFYTIMQILNDNILLKESLKDKCEIADERNQLLVENQKKDKIIDEMAKWLYEDDTWFGYGSFKEINTPEKIKRFFIKKVDEQE